MKAKTRKEAEWEEGTKLMNNNKVIGSRKLGMEKIYETFWKCRSMRTSKGRFSIDRHPLFGQKDANRNVTKNTEVIRIAESSTPTYAATKMNWRTVMM